MNMCKSSTMKFGVFVAGTVVLGSFLYVAPEELISDVLASAVVTALVMGFFSDND